MSIKYKKLCFEKTKPTICSKLQQTKKKVKKKWFNQIESNTAHKGCSIIKTMKFRSLFRSMS